MTVEKLPSGLHNFVSDSQDVEAIKATFPKAAEYDSFFVKTKDGEYTSVWGMFGIVPFLGNNVWRIAC